MKKIITRFMSGMVLFFSVHIGANASTVMTVGDSLSEGYGLALPKWLSGSGWKAVNAGKRSSGLVSSRPFDWMNSMYSVVGSHRPDVVLMSFGANDAGMSLKIGNRSVPFGSEEWALEYSARMMKMIESARSHGSFVIWMPIPSFSDPSRERAAAWVREIQRYTAYHSGVLMPDVSRFQSMKFKQKDGIHYNMLGYESAVDVAFKSAWEMKMRSAQTEPSILLAETRFR